MVEHFSRRLGIRKLQKEANRGSPPRTQKSCLKIPNLNWVVWSVFLCVLALWLPANQRNEPRKQNNLSQINKKKNWRSDDGRKSFSSFFKYSLLTRGSHNANKIIAKKWNMGFVFASATRNIIAPPWGPVRMKSCLLANTEQLCWKNLSLCKK